MDVPYVKQNASTGDCLLVHGTNTVQEGIEVATDSSFCHAALLVQTPVGLMVAEMVEGTGFQSMSFDDWLSNRPTDIVFYGLAPDVVRANGDRIIDSLKEYEDADKREYGYGELFEVWLSQFTEDKYPAKHEVCSLLVQHRWEIAGYPIQGMASPGSFLYLCQLVAKIVR